MTMRPRWTWALPVVVATAVTACIIAEPPSDPPRLPTTRPTIVRGSVVPPASKIIGRWPDRFIVPVELSDPTVSFEFAVWIDFNPATGEGLVDFRTSSFVQENTTGRVRRLEIPLSAPTDDRCHVVEVLVALRFVGQDSTGAHAFTDPGGDIVSWIYNPKGDTTGCPLLDAGIELIAQDAGDAGGEAGEAGPPP
jgi:hypothetical protein